MLFSPTHRWSGVILHRLLEAALILSFYCNWADAHAHAAPFLFSSDMTMMCHRISSRGRRVGTTLSFVHMSRRHIERKRTSRCLLKQHSGSLSSPPTKNVAIIGGGLAGLSVAYHLLDIVGGEIDNFSGGMHITIYDKANVGAGGASAVAGGLVHPFSPRGKLIHFGLPALDHSNHLIEKAAKHQPQCIVRPHLYRIALSSQNASQLQNTAETCPDLAHWLSKDDINEKFGLESLGGVKLGNGCRVIHVPSYLKGLLKECEILAGETKGSIKWEVLREPRDNQQSPEVDSIVSLNQKLSRYDAVIMAAGAGIVSDGLVGTDNELPVQLVRGQSIEMLLPKEEIDSNDNAASNEAFLCGKYVSPLPCNASQEGQRFVVGATHEFKNEALDTNNVMEELRSRSYQLAPHLWDHGKVERLTMGFRMQSHRGRLGRMPMIGRYADGENATIAHENLWIFTGLSSRGLIYHGIFGRWLADAVWRDDEEMLRDQFAEFDWWKKKMKGRA
ncbi:hypothetical protein ACHAWF_018281 [Thalassiosira exigua]